MSDSLPERPAPYVAVCIIVLIFATALALRFYHLGGTVFYSDQAFCWRLASADTLGELFNRAAGDTHPPGYFMVLRYFMELGWSSPFAIRSFSAIIGIASILVFYGFFREVMDWADSPCQWDSHLYPALFAVAIGSIHYVPLEVSRLARMYVLGMLLATASSWLLLKAMRSEESHWRWWCGYGLTAAAFCYMHNYAFFTLGAHAVIVSWFSLTRIIQLGKKSASKILVGFVGAASLAFILYLPWLPSFLGQFQRVYTHWVMPTLATERLEQILLSWTTGIGYWDGAAYHPRVGIELSTVSMPAIICMLFFEVLIVWFILRSDRAGLFFLILAIVPWGLGVFFSWYGERTIIEPRCLVFAHIGLIGMIGVAYARLKYLWARTLFAMVVFLPCLYGTWLHLKMVPPGPPAICEAAKYLQEHYQDRDVVLAPSPKRLLEMRYHADQIGFQNFNLRCPVPIRTDGGHVNLLSAISADEYLWPDGLPPSSINRIWLVNGDWFNMPAEWSGVTTKVYHAVDDWEEPSYSITLYERDNSKNE